MPLTLVEPHQHLYTGLFPPHPNPYYRHNYTNDFENERQLVPCRECDLEENRYERIRIPPEIESYHNTHSRFSDGMPSTIYHRVKLCSNSLSDHILNSRVEAHLQNYGLYWEVPWDKYKSKRLYVRPTTNWSVHEKNHFKSLSTATDKVNSSLLATEKGLIRYVPGLYYPTSRTIRSAWYENAQPHRIYGPPHWATYRY